MSSAKPSKRVRRMRVALLGTIAGVVCLGGLTYWVDAGRDTDLADPTAGLTSAFMEDVGDMSPLRFTDVAAELGISMQHGSGVRSRILVEDTGSGIAWGDVDADGDWDLYLVNLPGEEGEGESGDGMNRLYRNDGGQFVDTTEKAGVGDVGGYGMGASFVDYDDDGLIDLYVTNRGPNRLFRGVGGGVFEEVGATAGVDGSSWSTGVAWGDYDRDGHVDLFVCNYVDDQAGDDNAIDDPSWEGVPFGLNPNSFDPQPNQLYRNRGDGTFENVAVLQGVGDPAGRSLGATFCDLDGDGWLDLYVNNDVSTNRLYHNLGSGPTVSDGSTFKEVGLLTGTADPRGSMGLSVGEIGGTTGSTDGLPDLFITHWVAQENAIYESWLSPNGGRHEFRDRTRQLRLGDVSIDRVGWGTAMVDLDLDGRVDIAVVNGSTLETNEDASLLRAEPFLLFWAQERRFIEVAQNAGAACSTLHTGRALAAADYDGDGDVDLAIGINQGRPLLLRNDTDAEGRSLCVTLQASAAQKYGAKVQVTCAGQEQYRWYGSDVSYLSAHAPDLIFGLGAADSVDELIVTWGDGEVTRKSGVHPGQIRIER
jgi:enediyne biosynthesis protein E4